MPLFFRQILQDSKNNYSHKRLITLSAFVLVAIAFFAATFFGFPVHEYLISSLMFIIMAGMGIATAEPLASAYSSKKKSDTE